MPESAVLRDAALARVELAKPGTSVPTVFRHVLALAKEAVAKGYRFAKFAVETGRAFGRKVGQHLRSAWDSAMHWWHRGMKAISDMPSETAQADSVFHKAAKQKNAVSRLKSYVFLRYGRPTSLLNHLSMDQCISFMRSYPKEIGAIFNQTFLIEARIGTRTRVAVLLKYVKDNWFYHNHPDGGTFSLRDFKVMISGNGAGMKAICPEGTYTVERPLSGAWPSEDSVKIAYRLAEALTEAELRQFQVDNMSISTKSDRYHAEKIRITNSHIHDQIQKRLGIRVEFEKYIN